MVNMFRRGIVVFRLFNRFGVCAKHLHLVLTVARPDSKTAGSAYRIRSEALHSRLRVSVAIEAGHWIQTRRSLFEYQVSHFLIGDS
jgi:hypothetical protein